MSQMHLIFLPVVRHLVKENIIENVKISYQLTMHLKISLILIRLFEKNQSPMKPEFLYQKISVIVWKYLEIFLFKGPALFWYFAHFLIYFGFGINCFLIFVPNRFNAAIDVNRSDGFTCSYAPCAQNRRTFNRQYGCKAGNTFGQKENNVRKCSLRKTPYFHY